MTNETVSSRVKGKLRYEKPHFDFILIGKREIPGGVITQFGICAISSIK